MTGDGVADPAHADPVALARRRAVLPQDPQVSFEFTAADVVQFGRSPYRSWSGRDFEAAADALKKTGAWHLAGRRVGTLSGGERALVALARVLAQQTPVLLLDEPTAALDIRHQHTVLAAARQRADAGDTVLVVLHDLPSLPRTPTGSSCSAAAGSLRTGPRPQSSARTCSAAYSRTRSASWRIPLTDTSRSCPAASPPQPGRVRIVTAAKIRPGTGRRGRWTTSAARPSAPSQPPMPSTSSLSGDPSPASPRYSPANEKPANPAACHQPRR